MKPFLVKLFVFLSPFILMAFANYKIDNAHIFSGEEEYESIVDIIAHEHNVANLYNFNEILLYKNLIRNMSYDPDILVLGSSRSMEINNSMFPGKHIFNASISECSLKELIAIYSLCEQNKVEPKTIIYDVDPFIFIDAERSNGFRSELIDDYNSIAGKIGVDSTDKSKIVTTSITEGKNKIKELFNPEYFYENIRFGRKQFYQTDETFTDVNILCKDGSISYNKNYRMVSESKALNSAKLYLHTLDLDNKQIATKQSSIEIFEKFVDYIQKRHKIIFFLAPLHPFVINDFAKHGFKTEQLENYLIKVAKSKNIELIGSYNPEKLGLNSKDFYDGNHTRRNGIEKIFHDYHLQETKKPSIKQ